MNVEERLPDFTGKAVVFYVSAVLGASSWLTDGTALESPRFDLQAGRLFVTGRTFDYSEEGIDKEWSDNRDACLAWESVLYYIAMPTDEYRAFHKKGDQVPEAVEKKSTTRSQVFGLIIIILFMLILLASLIGITVWIVKSL